MSEKKITFGSILDFKPQYEDIIAALAPDIQFSYSAIINNVTMQTYFNILSMEYYGYEYYQLLRLHDLKFKLGEKLLNLTILEVVYNILLQVTERKWRYSEYIAYDVYIAPIRIKKYVNALGYKFVESETADRKAVWKLVSTKLRAISEIIKLEYYDDRINNIIDGFNSSLKNDVEQKLNLFKNMIFFVFDGRPFVEKRFGKQFSDDYYKKIDEMNKFKSTTLTEEQKNVVAKNIDELFEIGEMIMILLAPAIKSGAFARLKEEETKEAKRREAHLAIAEAEATLKKIAAPSKTTKTK
ncbi:hypothetical protein [Spiroplasma endosymbiont of Labia minor]|uniref:hypothetical protein n=1 Tax=Spiroplasma endosymbiont of Labia minor TaxID=3066305 RepID=UPI0030D32F0F